MDALASSLLHVHWLVPVAIYCIVAYVGVRWLSKHLADMPDQTKRLTINYAFCAAFGAVFAASTGGLIFDIGFLLVMVFGGVLNATAIMTNWKATRVSLSKTSLLSWGDDIVALLLAAWLVGDHKYLNAWGTVGMLVCIATGVLFWLHDWKKGRETRSFYINVVIYSMAWGVANFVIRYFALDKLPVGEFVFAWYLGSFLTMGATFVVERLRAGNTGGLRPAYKLQDYVWVALFAFGIAACLAIEFWALTLAPMTAVAPIFLVAEAVMPSIVGWVIFREAATFDRRQWAYAAVGIMGAVILASNMHLT